MFVNKDDKMKSISKTYTGIGSRNTPQDILAVMTKIAELLALNGYTLRSGGAKGADKAFEKGCDMVNGEKEIYLPWKGFEGNLSNLVVEDVKAFEIARKYHPYWSNLKYGAKKLQARNSHQILGKMLNNPTDFVLCYTKQGKGGGGTGQAIRIANAYNIPIFDFGRYDNIKQVVREFKNFYKSYNI